MPILSLLAGTLPEGFRSLPWVCTALRGATGQPDLEFRHVQRLGQPGLHWFQWPPTAVLHGMVVGHFARLQPPEQCGIGKPTHIKATGLQLSMSPWLRNQYWGSLNPLEWPHLSKLQESLPGPLCSSWGCKKPQQCKKPERKAVNGAWKCAKHRHPAREIGEKIMPKETTLGHS